MALTRTIRAVLIAIALIAAVQVFLAESGPVHSVTEVEGDSIADAQAQIKSNTSFCGGMSDDQCADKCADKGFVAHQCTQLRCFCPPF